MSRRKHWCDKCEKEVEFNREKDFTKRDETLNFKGETVTVKAQIPICSLCKAEITDEMMDSARMKAAIEMWESQTGKKFT